MGVACCKSSSVLSNEDVAQALAECIHSHSDMAVPKDLKVFPAVDEAMPAILRKVSRASVHEVVAEHFPMHTISMRTFMALAAMESFGQLMGREVLVVTAAEAVVHFVSHEWLGFTHPDPNGEQLRRMQDVFQTVMDGRILDLFHEEDWKSYSERVSSGSKGHFRALEASYTRSKTATLTEDGFKQQVAEGDVWLDYASIPQRQDFVDPAMLEAVMARAVRSIPAYLERCDYFWVLTPTAKHADKGTWCSFTTWRSRGWCRLEEWGNFLSTNSCAPLIITHAPKLSTIGFMDFLMAHQGKKDMAPCSGAFTCCRLNHEMVLPSGEKQTIPCDKEFVLPVLTQLFENKMRQVRSIQNKMLYGVIRCTAEPMIFGGALTSPTVDSELLDESIPEFLERCGMESLTEGLGEVTSTMSVFPFAAAIGSVPMLRRLQADPEAMAVFKKAQETQQVMDRPFGAMLANMAAMQGRVKALEEMLAKGMVTHDHLDVVMGGEKITQLDRAAKYGFPRMVHFLLERKANLHNRRANGSTPLHGAAEAGHACCCRVLIDNRADVNAIDEMGKSPLHLAADPVTFYGRGEGKPVVLEVLLHGRADLNLRDSAGQTALDIARAARFHDGEDVFLVSKSV